MRRRYCFVLVVSVLLDEAPVELPTELDCDWLPVVPVLELLDDWSPVVALVLLLSDWFPVDVVLSIVRLERPRRSISGLKVEVEPVCAFWLFAVDPVAEELELGDEPEIEGLMVLLPDRLTGGLADALALLP